MTDVRQTSLIAYQQIIEDGTKKNQKSIILNLLKEYPDGFTREEIRDMASIMYTSVCGRVKELLNSGKAYENEHNTRINASGKKALVVKAYG